MIGIIGGSGLDNHNILKEVKEISVKIPYAAVAMSTDYDCWKEGEKSVTWEQF